jgi:hypothetical protein
MVFRHTRLVDGKFNLATVPAAQTCAERSKRLSVDALTTEWPFVWRKFWKERLARIEKHGNDCIRKRHPRLPDEAAAPHAAG